METSLNNELETRIADLETRVARAQTRLEKYRADLEALIRARDILAGESGSGGGKSSGKGAVVKAVRATLKDMVGEFGSKEIQEYMERRWPDRKWDRTSISTTLRRLTDDGVLINTEEASGRSPGRFRKATEAE